MSKAKASAPVAQYYPHTRVHSESLLKTALLLWDHVDCIVPDGNFVPEKSKRSKLLLEAEEILIRSRVPSVVEKRRVHSKVEELLKDGVPRWLHRDLQGADSRHYLIYPEKLAWQTLRLLKEAELAEAISGEGRNVRVSPSLGLWLMSMLAEECAGTTHIRVTDRTQSYTWLMGVMTEACGGQFVDIDGVYLGRNLDRLVTAAIYTVNTDGIPLKKLVELRKKELKGSSDDYAAFRRSYLQRIRTYVEQLNVCGLSDHDIGEIHRQYRQEMSNDLRDLRRDLDVAAGAVLDSRAIGTAVLAVAGSAITPLAGIVGAGALIHQGQKYLQARRAALKSHAMSWLFLAS